MPNNPPQYTDASRGIRLHKALADAGVASRRDCEKIVTDGRVTVNGDRITKLPAWVDPYQDIIAVDGQPLPRAKRHKATDRIYLMVNKPRKVISTNDDPEGRARVVDLVDYPGSPRLFPVGRLDADSTGLILLTNDGELANRLTHPRYEVTKRYEVKVKGKLNDQDLTRLRDGLILAHKTSDADHTPVKPKRAAMESVVILGHERDVQRGDRTTLGVTLREGQNREIRRLLARLGYNVRKLKRTAIGPLPLKGVPVGGWRPLTTIELQNLRKVAGLSR